VLALLHLTLPLLLQEVDPTIWMTFEEEEEVALMLEVCPLWRVLVVLVAAATTTEAVQVVESLLCDLERALRHPLPLLVLVVVAEIDLHPLHHLLLLLPNLLYLQPPQQSQLHRLLRHHLPLHLLVVVVQPMRL